LQVSTVILFDADTALLYYRSLTMLNCWW